MYNQGAGIAAGGTAVLGVTYGVLPHTGADILWFALAAFALLAAGIAVLRVVPRKQG